MRSAGKSLATLVLPRAKVEAGLPCILCGGDSFAPDGHDEVYQVPYWSVGRRGPCATCGARLLVHFSEPSRDDDELDVCWTGVDLSRAF